MNQATPVSQRLYSVTRGGFGLTPTIRMVIHYRLTAGRTVENSW
jgi:hypothetical protein